jgi:exodeoxyribonuclease-1
LAATTFYWHDYETFGADPSRDRPAQFAGVRTDADLNIIDEPLTVYCKPANDFLPHPAACLITGITPQKALAEGLPECEFIARIHRELARPGTCGVGYNSIRFDDEVTRYTLYRNFFDPYAREWQNGNSRWDIIDMLRTMRSRMCLRPSPWPGWCAIASRASTITCCRTGTSARRWSSSMCRA